MCDKRVVTIAGVTPQVPAKHYDLQSRRIVEPPVAATLKASEVVMEPGAWAEAHIHPEHEQLFIVTVGEMGLRIDGGEVRLRAGEAALVHPGELHENFNAVAAITRYLVISARVPDVTSEPKA
jgi:quercetin dioxygenase-like cupin family protein